LIVSWEYPPVLVGGLGRHVADLAQSLHEQQHEVRVLTRGNTARTRITDEGGIVVGRAGVDPIAPDFAPDNVLAWVGSFEDALILASADLLRDWSPEVIHGHDWLVAQTVRTLAAQHRAPVVMTVHSTEYGRQQGWLDRAVPRAIHAVERRMCTEAAAVVACSDFMADQLRALFQLAPADVSVVGNGIDVDAVTVEPREVAAARAEHAGAGPLLVFAGRLVHEKGLQELIKAMPAIVAARPGARLIVAGSGHLLADQQDRARRYGVSELVVWTGFLDRRRLSALVAAADVAVVPSLYEPFGLVALEAQALGTAVAVSDTGGLTELVEPGRTGERFATEDPAAIARAVLRLLDDPPRTAAMIAHARQRAVDTYSWPALADRTAQVYRSVVPVLDHPVQASPDSTR
jgi:glycogen(starch) synthase